MGFEIKRHDSEEAPGVVQQQVTGLPAGISAGATGLFQAVQEFMSQEGVIDTRHRVPGSRADFVETVQELRAHVHRAFHPIP